MKRLCATALLCLWGCCALAAGRSATIVYINGSKYYIHTVQTGETLYGLAKTYGVGEQVILENNPSAAGGLKADTNLKIPYVADTPEAGQSERKLRKTFDSHFVVRGETLYAIARQYGIPVATLLEDNPNLDPLHMQLGQRILVRKKEIGTENETEAQLQWDNYRRSLNSAPDSESHHIVQPGETLYSLARRFGVTESELSALNGGLRAADLKAGSTLRIPQQQPAVASEAPEPPRAAPTEEAEFRALRYGQPLNVALLLPLAVGDETNANYLEFYQGFLMGADSARIRSGYSVHIDLFNTARDSVRIGEILEDEAFQRADLIIGPVYEDELAPVVRFAEQKRIPVVSPLAQVEQVRSDVLFQLAPDPACKYEKVGDLVGPDKRVTLIYTESFDREFEREVLGLLGHAPYVRHEYRYEHPSKLKEKENDPGDLTPLLENKDDNVFVILADNEVDVERILTGLASAETSLVSRGHTAPRFTILGNARWNRYPNIDRAMFFKNRVVFVTTYHAKRDSHNVRAFDRAYLRTFGALPTLFSYRGYDAASIFIPAMYDDIEYDLEDRRYTPLQTAYKFKRSEGNHLNRNWTRVNYLSDYTITIE